MQFEKILIIILSLTSQEKYAFIFIVEDEALVKTHVFHRRT